jgi:hypothetical protein
MNMSSDGSGFDERRVLGELEQLHNAILESREKRERAQAAFQVHLETFRAPGQPSSPVIATPATTPLPVPSRVEPPPLISVKPEPPPLPLPVIEPPLVEARPVPAASDAGARAGQARMRAIAGAVLFVVLALAAWMLLRSPDEPAAARVDPPPPVTATPAPAPARAPAPPVDPHPLRIDIVTLRKVWMRVTVDGRIAIERELPEGERLPFGADKSIVVRAGDAGAVSVRVGSADQGAMGKDGQVVSRTYTVPPR